MNIGIFDSGLGGLIILKSIIKKLPQYDYVYFGDTAHMPYGEKSQQEIYRYTVSAVEFLFRHHCQVVIVACNTVSARALRRLQREFVAKKFPARRVLGVIVPTLEDVASDASAKRIGILATKFTVESRAYLRELKKINPKLKIFQQSAPRLASLLEEGKGEEARAYSWERTRPLVKQRIDSLVLACTHYGLIKKEIRKDFLGKVYAQDELIGAKLAYYLKRHPEMANKIKKNHRRAFFVSLVTEQNQKLAKKWFGKNIKLQKVNY